MFLAIFKGIGFKHKPTGMEFCMISSANNLFESFTITEGEHSSAFEPARHSSIAIVRKKQRKGFAVAVPVSLPRRKRKLNEFSNNQNNR